MVRYYRKNKRLAIVELGCGVSQHSIRFVLKNNQYTMMSNEWKLPKNFLNKKKTKMIRINPDAENETGVITINLGAKKAMRMIAK